MQRDKALLFLSVIALTTALSSFAQLPKKQAVREQTSFCEDEPLLKPVIVPKNVVEVLMNTAEGKEAVEAAANESTPLDPAKLFKASEVHLEGSNEAALFILGTSPMSGADNTWFWLVRRPRIKPEIILFDGGNCLNLLHTKTSGYRDVQVVWSSPAETITKVLRFNGSLYKQSRKTSKTNNW